MVGGLGAVYLDLEASVQLLRKDFRVTVPQSLCILTASRLISVYLQRPSPLAGPPRLWPVWVFLDGASSGLSEDLPERLVRFTGGLSGTCSQLT